MNDNVIGVLIIGLVVVVLGIGLYATASNSTCNKKLYRCVDGVLYKDSGDMMIDTGKRCIAK